MGKSWNVYLIRLMQMFMYVVEEERKRNEEETVERYPFETM